MTRQFWAFIHRYAGLTLAFFLIVAGLTGSILAFRGEIEHWLNPEDYEEPYHIPIQDKPVLDPFELRERAMALEPGAQCNSVPLHTEPGKVFTLACEILIHKGNTETPEYRNISVNPYTGERIPINLPILNVDPGLWPVTRKNLMACIFLLHISLLLDEVGAKIFGIAALIWTLDCFVGFYLTLPRRRKNETAISRERAGMREAGQHLDWLPRGLTEQLCLNTPSTRSSGAIPTSVLPPNLTLGSRGEGRKGFLQRWQVAWKVKWPSSSQRLNFDLHRASGLWFWLFLFIFAWSSVMFNLPEVYEPVMKRLFEVSEADPYQALPQPLYHPFINFKNAYSIGKRLMAEQAQQRKGFFVLKELALSYDPAKGLYSYQVHSNRDLSDHSTTTYLRFDATSGVLEGLDLSLSTGGKSGDTITSWLRSLHLVTIWGLPYRIFVCILGLVITMLSVTGVYIWRKKRLATKAMQKKMTSAANMSGLNN